MNESFSNDLAAFDPSGGDVVAFAHDERAAGRDAAIITLAGIEGSSPRSLGAQMAVARDGRFVGSISSGCLERAIINEARAAIERGAGVVVRYGAGSPFKDIILPCGAGVDLLYTVNPTLEPLNAAVAAQEERRVCALTFRSDGVDRSDDTRSSWRGEAFTRVYKPRLKIVAAGAGAELIVLSRLATAAGYDVCAISTDAQTLDHCAANEKIRLQSVSAIPDLAIDQWTAVASLFHDREWELALASRALASSAFYVGAVGSSKTAAARKESLRAEGVGEERIQRLQGPIGLVPATRDPSALAVSILAEIIEIWSGEKGR